MALIKCPDCGKMFSEYANNCPICGCPAKDAKTVHDTRKRQQRIDDFIASKPQELQKSIELHERKLEEVNKLICPICGKDIHPENTYCSSCGSRIRFDEKPKVIERRTPVSSVSQGAQQPIKKKTWLWVAIFSTISVLAVAVLVLAYFFILPMFSNQSTNGENVSTENTIVDESSDMGTTKQAEVNSYSENETQYDFVCKRPLTDSDLIGLSPKELRIMRNWIYARHGYIFKSPDLQDYFDRMSWYSPKYSDVSSMLSETEKDNVYIIKSYE